MFHINNDGDVRPCKSEKDLCPFVNNPHFLSEKKATSHYETTMQENIVQVSRKHVGTTTDSNSTELKDGDTAQSIVEKESQTVKSEVSFKFGSRYFGAVVTEQSIKAQIVAWQEHVGVKTAENMREQKIARDREDSYHITVIAPNEIQELSQKIHENSELTRKEKYRATTALLSKSLAGEFEFTVGGVGKASNDDKEAWFVIVKSVQADKSRAELGLPPKDYHITLGFLNGDVHGQAKDDTTKVVL